MCSRNPALKLLMWLPSESKTSTQIPRSAVPVPVLGDGQCDGSASHF
jgi:hypothetical protein